MQVSFILTKAHFLNSKGSQFSLQAPTHILASLVIRESFRWRYYGFFSFLLTAVVAFLSHGFLDKLARLTYHPSQAALTDIFWMGFHTMVVLVTLVLLYLFGKKYFWAIFFSVLPDIDWLILHTANALGKEVVFYKTPHFHNALNWMMEHTIPFCYLDNLLDFRLIPIAFLVELLLCGLLWQIYKFLTNRRRNIHF